MYKKNAQTNPTYKQHQQKIEMQYKLRLRLIDSINLIRFVLFLFRLQLFEIRLWFLSTSLYEYIEAHFK